MAWGAATSRPDIFASGFKKFDHVTGHMDDNGKMEESLRDNNENIQFLLVAAEAAARNGIDAYSISYGGKTLHDAVTWHAEQTLENPEKKYFDETAGNKLSHLRRVGHALGIV
tara:strand:+ start:1517 stop:1855 length:339 start_codon:yes stop_codon:yes gene_type:complete